jgi:hypothetical protein
MYGMCANLSTLQGLEPLFGIWDLDLDPRQGEKPDPDPYQINIRKSESGSG